MHKIMEMFHRSRAVQVYIFQGDNVCGNTGIIFASVSMLLQLGNHYCGRDHFCGCTVPLGLLFKNENKNEVMFNILQELHDKYVLFSESSLSRESSGKTVLEKIFFGVPS